MIHGSRVFREEQKREHPELLLAVSRITDEKRNVVQD
jgi:hypothetical protein